MAKLPDTYKIPADWNNISEGSMYILLRYLIDNCKTFKLSCAEYKAYNDWINVPYYEYEGDKLPIKISTPYGDVNISKTSSPEWQRGGRAVELWTTFGQNDYGYWYDGYTINCRSVFINQKHMLWPKEYPDNYELYFKINDLYLSARAETFPTLGQKKDKKAQLKEQGRKRKSQKELLEQLLVRGHITKKIYKEYMNQK